MADSAHTIREEINAVALFIGAIWGGFIISLAFPALDNYGVIPRRIVGLVGIPAMPFLHANFQHLLGNTIPLVVLLILLAGSRAESWQVVLDVALLGGLLLWIFGREAVHIGASGLISGLTALLIALIVGFLYGGSLILGVIPCFGSNISWDGHLCGAIAGGIVAYALARGTRKQPAEGKRVGQDKMLEL